MISLRNSHFGSLLEFFGARTVGIRSRISTRANSGAKPSVLDNRKSISNTNVTIITNTSSATPTATTMDEALVDMTVLSSLQQRIAAVVLDAPRQKRRKIDHRTLPRESRRQFRHTQAHACIMYDYLGPTPLFNGREFEMMFRVSRTRFQCLLEDFGSSGNPFCHERTDCFKRESASIEAKLLLPLKCLAYGVPPHCFTDYFSMSRTLARDCFTNFNDMVVELHLKEYLRAPSSKDLESILKLHRKKHRNIDGIIGSLDCMHTYWDKCPVAWQGAFKNGSKKKPSIVLEAVSDYHMWFWHASYGYAGTLNDINIMNLSPLYEMFVNGEMEKLEKSLVPFSIGKESFKHLFVLVDGIYPVRTRFVKAIKEPISDREKALSSWQEAARKDIERAFGLLQTRFKVLSRAILLRKLEKIESMVTACLILHNMLVSDRIMEGDCRARYDPANNLVVVHGDTVDVEDAADYAEVVKRTKVTAGSKIGARNADEEAVQVISRRSRFLTMIDKEESGRLHTALMDVLGQQYQAHKNKKKKRKQML